MITNQKFILNISLLLCFDNLFTYSKPINQSAKCQNFINQLQKTCPELRQQVENQGDLFTIAMLLEHGDQTLDFALLKKCKMVSHVSQCLSPAELTAIKELESIRYLQQNQALAVWTAAKDRLVQS